MKKPMLLITLLAAIIFQSCHKIKGNGPLVSKSYNLSGFSEIESSLDADVYITQDSFYKVEIIAQQNILDVIQTPIVNGALSIQIEKYKNVVRYDRVEVHITAPNIIGLRINGTGSVTALQPISSGNLAVAVSGSGHIKMAGYTGNSLTARISGSGEITINGGSVNTEEVKIDGSGEVDMMGVSAKTAEIETSGSATTSVWVSDYLDVEISGSGNVYYMGNPATQISISGSGKVIRR
jgi:hypothetical protein